jgi:hypothetical protein
MNFKLIFCADGILRAQFTAPQPMIALKFLQEQEGVVEDWKWWAKWWEATVIFEKGLTVSAFLKGLEPWKDYWDVAIGKSVSAYIAESKKPTLLTSESSLDYISIFYGTYVSEEIDFEEQIEDTDSLQDWFDKPSRYCFTGWTTHAYYHMSGYLREDETSYDIHLRLMNELANVLLYLDDRQYLSVSDTLMKKSLPSTERLLNKKALAVRQCHDYYFIESPKEHRLRDVVEAFFWWLPTTPRIREEIIDIMDSGSHKENGDNNNSDTLPEQESNLIDKVVIEPDAFFFINRHYENDEQYWNYMLNQLHEGNSIPKIGELKKAQLPEQRYGNNIINPRVIRTRYFD